MVCFYFCLSLSGSYRVGPARYKMAHKPVMSERMATSCSYGTYNCVVAQLGRSACTVLLGSKALQSSNRPKSLYQGKLVLIVATANTFLDKWKNKYMNFLRKGSS